MSDKTIRFRAGIAEYNEESHMCTPLPVQGLVKIQPNEEGAEMGFWDFEWHPIEKTAGNKHEPISLILIPGETAWIEIKSAKGGRVFGLIFSSNQKYFFWLQEKNKGSLGVNDMSPADKEIFDKIQKILNEPVFDEDESSDEKMDVDDEKPDTSMKEPEGEELA